VRCSLFELVLSEAVLVIVIDFSFPVFHLIRISTSIPDALFGRSTSNPYSDYEHEHENQLTAFSLNRLNLSGSVSFEKLSCSLPRRGDPEPA